MLAELKEIWDWVTLNPWGALSLIGIAGIATWRVVTWQSKAQIEFMRERLAAYEANDSGRKVQAFGYPREGRFGKNVLANTTSEVVLGKSVSMRADIPEGSRLLIELRASQPGDVDRSKGGWYYAIGGFNWTSTGYDHDEVRQPFVAEGGMADLCITFQFEGEVLIIAREGDAQRPSWERKFRVKAS